MVGLTYRSGDCFDAFGDPIAGDTLHEVRLVGDFGAESWQTPVQASGVAQSAPLDFNLLAFDRVSGVPDLQGALAAGGDVTLQSFSVNASSRKPIGLIVGGALDARYGTISGNLAHGSGSVGLQSVNLQGVQMQGVPLAFDELELGLGSMSESMRGREANGNVTQTYGQLDMTGSEPGLNVFAVSAQQLAAANGIRITTPAGATALVNVSGESVSMSNLQITLSGATRSSVLWNLHEATYFKLRSISFQGSALAPKAYADVSNGNFEGTLVAQSVVGSMQFHDYPLTAWDTLGAGTPSTSVTLRPNARLRAGCEYSFIVAAYPANAAGDCLESDVMQSFLVADDAKSRFDREVGSRRLEHPAELPVAFTALEGINSLVPDVFKRYAEDLRLRAGVDTLAPVGSPKPMLDESALRRLSSAGLEECFARDPKLLKEQATCLPVELGRDRASGHPVVARYHCSDICPAMGGVFLALRKLDSQACCKVGGAPFKDPAWGGYVGCMPGPGNEARHEAACR
jgi:choice-of-anchor A domain-containing protein